MQPTNRRIINTGIYSWEPIPLLNRNGGISKYTRKQAQRIANKWASESKLSHAIGVVSGCGAFWRISVCAQPYNHNRNGS